MPSDQIVSGPTTLTPFQATYHWRNKNCYPWAAQWFKSNLPGLSIENEGHSAEITTVDEVEGDVDLGQRKGKILTIYDCKIVMSWKGKTAAGDEIEGKVTVPEVSHEMIDGHSKYEYEFSLIKDDAFRTFLRSNFPPILAAKFDSFPKVLVEKHGQPTTTTPSGSGSGSATPQDITVEAEPEAQSTQAKKPVVEEKKSLVGGTSSVEVESRLAASAEDMWLFLTDEKRVPMWTRSPAKISAQVGSEFEMFGGNIRGKIISAEPGQKLVQSWQLRSPNWPSEHHATMTTTFDQGSDSTLVKWSLAGVPKGQEETLRGALEGYYVNGFKQIGLVTSPTVSRIIQDVPQTSSSSSSTARSATKPKEKAKRKKRTTASSSSVNAVGWGDVVTYSLVAGSIVGFIGIVWGSFRQ
ncbi:hypothetical protein FFLO_06392 [Filobasidium floriforme]|uniref:Activator of Hsp90 ATPase AHSA1-like N-terminal domain-containing protein n=1 Tax=Filobasidium floriforme TaxID=5210 RepID=A0A8K0NQH6_9TREE|nr:activator of Hsp90 ATPase [Filobasidium floriforme]KAG7528126.1 hypothetical protein FFLO_06392 [Filobasidium floriforme]KAH8085211.1 activator of Hsp90 ATPase [Filobasidium floriforme]